MADQRKASRRAKGDGASFWSKTKQLHIARATVAGRRIECSGKTKAIALARLRAAGGRLPDDTPTVSQWCDDWLGSLTVRPLTYTGYKTSVEKRIRPVLGNLTLASVTAFDIEQASKKWATSVGSNTIRLTLAHLRIAFAAAVRARLVTTNPVASARKPRSVKSVIDPFTEDELRRIIAVGCTDPQYAALALLAATGCRRGEVIALDVSDVDLARATVAITKGHQGKHGIGEPKSPHSVRTLELHASVLPAVKAAIDARKSGPLFRTSTGGRAKESTLAERLQSLCAELNIPYRSIHKLRHGVAMTLDGAGMPISQLAAWLGDLPATVARRYLQAKKGNPVPFLKAVFG
jgi:integrase